MRFPLAYFFRQALFWFIFFDLGRLIFIFYNLAEMKKVGLGEVLAVFWHDKALDLSVTSYLLALPWLLLSLQALSGWSFLSRFIRGYHLLMAFIVALITAAELGLYDEWGTKINYKAIRYLEHPSEVYNTAGPAMTVVVFMLVALQWFMAAWLYGRLVHGKKMEGGRRITGGLAFLLAMPLLLFLGMRGGWKPIPINQSAAYFSRHNVVNQASVNSSWNLLHSITENYGNLDKNPFIYMPQEEADAIVQRLYKNRSDSFPRILTTTRPNIVLVILESWSADLIPELGGDTGITSEFSRLASEGILFTETYASGTRSHEGMGAIFSGFPAQSITAIVDQPDKFPKLPMISKVLKREGYHTSFFFGGQLIYGNIKGYIYNGGFDKILEETDFGDDVQHGRLGVHDEFVFARHLKELHATPNPFFSTVFTLSTHAPFDMPMKSYPVNWGGEERMYLNSARYTDVALGKYLEKASKEPWYNETLFVIVADHSHRSQKMRPFYSHGYHKIPMLLYGNVIRKEFRGMQVDKIASQVDLAATLLPQLNLDAEPFSWSKNLLDSLTPGFAFHAFTEGFGWVKPEGYFSYQHSTKACYEEFVDSLRTPMLKKEGWAYMQSVFAEYLDY